jgi:tRNA (cytosine34-C5)-methyltransferase
MIPSHFLWVSPGDSVLDCCAAPGSKTAQILEMLHGVGCVVANDSDPRRCHALVHQIQRVGTSNVLVVCDNAQYLEFYGATFDRVLSDVPCSGDGTLRKNAAAGAKWTPKGGGSVHGLQRTILRRGLELLKPGGLAVYSTCSMNPIENESVVNSVLLELGGCVEIVDVSERLPRLVRHPGMTDWPVFDTGNDAELVRYDSADQVPAARRQFAHPTMFPRPQVPGLVHCMRFYPQDADGGGFFVATLRKISDFARISRPPSNWPKKLREAPYVPIASVSTDVLAEVQGVFGFGESFPSDKLFVRDERSVRKISYVADPFCHWFQEHGSEAFRTISCGCPIFVWRGFGSGKHPVPSAAQEGLPFVMKYAIRRVFTVNPIEMKKLLLAGHRAVPHHDLTAETFEQFRDDIPNGCILHIPETLFAYPGMSFKRSICVYVRKDLIDVELRKLQIEYPDLPDIAPTAWPAPPAAKLEVENAEEEDKEAEGE